MAENTNKPDLTTQLEQLRRAHEAGLLDDNVYEAMVDRLQGSQQVEVQEGSAAIGNEAKAAGKQAVLVTGTVLAPIVTGTYSQQTTIVSPPGPDPESLRHAYLQWIMGQTGQLSLTGIDPKAASDAESRLHLGAVYTALLTQTQEHDLDLTQRPAGRRLSALAQLNQHQHLVLLGDPGSGKSTFVNFVAWCLAGEALGDANANLQQLTRPLPDNNGQDAKEPQNWTPGPLLPVRVFLRDLAARALPQAGEPAYASHLWDFVTQELKTASLSAYLPHLQEALRQPGGLLLLDGLDEVPSADDRRLQIRQMVDSFVTAFPHCRVLVTSRTYAYQKQNWRLPGFQETVLAPFTEGQIRRFVERWYAHIGTLRNLSSTDAQGRAELLKRAIFASDRLSALAERPILLTLMASLHAWRGGTLPEKREALYADTVDLLLDWWESPKLVVDRQGNPLPGEPSLAEWLKVDRERVRALLERLAFMVHSRQPELVGTADIPEADLITGLLNISQNPDLRPARLVEYLSQRAGLLLPRGVGIYTFPHRTFQEYLAACYLTGPDYPDAMVDLVRDDPQRWREVALLSGAKAARGSSASLWNLVEALCYREVTDNTCTQSDGWGAQIAGQLLAESGLELTQISHRHQPKLERTRQWLVHLLTKEQFPATERATAGVSLAYLGDPRMEVMDIDRMEFCLVPEGAFWMGSEVVPETEDKFWRDVYEKEKPQHEVTIPYVYWLGRYPITNAQFQAFVGANGYQNPDFWPEARREQGWQDGQIKVWDWLSGTAGFVTNWRSAPYDYGSPFHLPNHPVVGVSWYEALAFTRWLTRCWHEAGLLPTHWQVHLPTEAQWEKGARGGWEIPNKPVIAAASHLTDHVLTPTLQPHPDPRMVYPWQGAINTQQANYRETKIGATNPVGIFPLGRSPYGCEEMVGNIWEWTQTQFKAYPYQMDDGREDVNKVTPNTAVSFRGSSIAESADNGRCACRVRRDPGYRLWDVGFRVAVSVRP